MQLSTERRSSQLTRVPLDDVLIDLVPDGTNESFAADGVNVGLGGLSMRASILPDIGSKLRCRFQSPHDGVPVDADCEVVWAEANGPNIGEFGLRFTGITDKDQSSIEALVHAWSSDILGDEPRNVELRIDGVGSALEGEVAHDAGDALIVEQPLPFLRLGTGVSEGKRSGVLQGIDLRFEDSLPRLVLTVEFDDGRVEAPVGLEGLGSLERVFDERSGEDTLMDGAAPLAPDGFVRPGLPSFAPNDGPSPSSAEALSESHQAVRYEEAGEAHLDVADLRPRVSIARFTGWVRPVASKVRPLFVALWVRSGPRLRGLGVRFRHFFGVLGGTVATGVDRLRGRVARRRKTASRRTSGQPSSKRGRIRLALAVVLLGVAAYYLFGTGEGVALAKAPLVVTPDAELVDDSDIASTSSTTVRDVLPDVRPATAPGQTPATSPYAREEAEEEIVSADRVESGTVENGRSYTLRMSLAPRGMRGQDTDDGIRVVILGSNAIDGARRIASADPRIAAASILNHGEEAELRLRFTDGERPAYRVESRSSTLVVTVGD